MFNDCESLHEIEVTPDRLREIANEMERKSKNEFYQLGQVIRFKLNHRFAFTFKPEKPSLPMPKEITTEQVEESWTVPMYGDTHQ